LERLAKDGAVAHSIHVWLNVINAILLRDIRVRAGRFYVGYIIIFLMPFAHLGVILFIFSATNKTPQVGTSAVIFFGVSILPFVIFVYPARQILLALMTNSPLLRFSRVKIIDLFVARGLLETANGMAVSAIVCLALFIATGEFTPRDPLGFVCALLLTLYLGCGWGAYNALIAHKFHFWSLAFNLFFPLLWIVAGIAVNNHGFPNPYPRILAFNPLFQCVEYIRYSYYEGYPDDLLDVGYIFWFATCLIAAALILERTFRRILLAV
jgi:capsular polysaccharide transport system permease protein